MTYSEPVVRVGFAGSWRRNRFNLTQFSYAEPSVSSCWGLKGDANFRERSVTPSEGSFTCSAGPRYRDDQSRMLVWRMIDRHDGLLNRPLTAVDLSPHHETSRVQTSRLAWMDIIMISWLELRFATIHLLFGLSGGLWWFSGPCPGAADIHAEPRPVCLRRCKAFLLRPNKTTPAWARPLRQTAGNSEAIAPVQYLLGA